MDVFGNLGKLGKIAAVEYIIMRADLRRQRNALVHALAATNMSLAQIVSAVQALFGQAQCSRRRVRFILAQPGRPAGANPHPNTRCQPSAIVLDLLYVLFAYNAGYNHGWRFVQSKLEHEWPALHFSRRAVKASMVRVNPQASAVRSSGAFRGAVKNGVFVAPYFGSLWQSDLNLVLAEWGIAFSSVVDVCTCTWLGLTVITDKLAATVWAANERVVEVWGGHMPDVWTTDCGTETYVTALAARLMKRWAVGGVPRIPAHRFLSSTRQSIVESRNNQINTHLCLHAKLCFVYMEDVVFVLDRTNPYHKGAVQVLMGALLQHAANGERERWDLHPVRDSRRTKGKPYVLRGQHPHPGPRTPLTRGIDFVDEYERACGTSLPREPSWASRRDPLYGQPQQQALRKAAVLAIWGSFAACWADVLHNRGRARFIPAFQVYLLFR
jgi:hypothetical protein